MQNYYDNYETDIDDMSLSDQITKTLLTRYTSPSTHDYSRSFYIKMMTVFIFFSVSAQMMNWFKAVPRNINLMDKFLDELYGHTTDDDELPELLEDLSPIIKRYEEKYADEVECLILAQLSNARLEALSNNYVMENTPNGNVMMRYNLSKGSFEYYSDNIIPNRFLDVVARKFVKTYDCVVLYKSLSTVQEEEEVAPVASVSNAVVFAKFKTYNNPKASTMKNVTKKSMPVISSNRYTSCGKMANMQMLKKVDRKMVDKSYAMSFAEFKLSQADK